MTEGNTPRGCLSLLELSTSKYKYQARPKPGDQVDLIRIRDQSPSSSPSFGSRLRLREKGLDGGIERGDECEGERFSCLGVLIYTRDPCGVCADAEDTYNLGYNGRG